MIKKIFLYLSSFAIYTLLIHPYMYGQQQVNIGPPAGVPVVGINNFVRFIINLLFFLAVLAALLFLIIAGVKWILSGGDKGAVESARNQIIAALIGLVIVIFSFFILSFVLTLLGLPGITTLQVPTLQNPNAGPY